MLWLGTVQSRACHGESGRAGACLSRHLSPPVPVRVAALASVLIKQSNALAAPARLLLAFESLRETAAD